MSRLDRFLQAMRDHSAEAVRLGAGKPVRLLLKGAWRPVTRDLLDEAQVAGLIREIAPPAMAALLRPDAELRFLWASSQGEVLAELAPEDGGSGMTLRFTAASAVAVPVAPRHDAGHREEMDSLFRRMYDAGASDLHLRAGEPPLLRKDGELVRLDLPAVEPGRLEQLLLSIMGHRELEAYRADNDADWAYELPGVARFRCNAGRDRMGPLAVFRVIPATIRTAEEMGLSKQVQDFCYLTKGLVLVTGPTGSGKSTTLAGLVDLMNRTRSDHILTIEDPVEFVHQSKKCLVTQRQVGLHTRTFKSALRAALREDPDIILVGEMRDLETVHIALETAETGHLVFGTLHTTTAASTLDRIIDQFPADRQSQIRVMLSESLRGVVAQVLCKKIGGGRVAAREILVTIPAVANLVREGKTFQIPTIMQTNRKVGMVMLNDALMELVESRQVEPREAWMKSAEKIGMLQALKAKGHNVSFAEGP